MASGEVSRGIVVRIKGSGYFVTSCGEEVRCSLRGRFRLGESPEEVLPVVGDNVDFRREQGPDHRGPTGLIVAIHPRKSVFARSAPYGKKKYRILGANLDYVLLVVAPEEPPLNLRLVDRMLVAGECGGMKPVICVNKMDLARDTGEVKEMLFPYEKMGYPVVYCSALARKGLARLKRLMSGKKSIMVGPSGAGKTSLVSVLQPGLEVKVRRVSTRTGKGRHTTTHFELHPLAGGGYLGDTPGIREFGIWGVTHRNLDRYFRDFVPFLEKCRFATCVHHREPGCAIKDAVSQGLISRERHESYVRILETLPPG